SWEEEYARSWDALTEDVHGSLEGAVAAFLTSNKRRRILRDTAAVQRGIIRHLFLIIDLSESMLDRDMRPSRLELTIKYAQEFVTEFFDQNPISQLGIIVTRDGMAERISPLGGNPVEHLKALQNKKKLLASGEPSLQNALNMARSGLAHLPTHGSREVVIVYGSLTTCDPGNIHDTIQALAKDRVRVTIIGLSAEVSLCREICKQTRGTFSVCLNEDHFKDLLFESILPPASVKAQKPGGASNGADLMVMGFPTLLTHSQFASLCSCHSKLYKSRGYICPRCDSKLCEVPTECGICRLTIVSSPHLARSYRHLFPIGNWLEVNGGEEPSTMPSHCYGCSVAFPPFAEPTGAPPTAHTAEVTAGAPGHPAQPPPSTTGRYECPKCKKQFCIDCDIYVHQLGACPGC
ncbi:Ssl1-domain-containing protein, partial [Cystobasidium minutum MCA 4210]|uniref:Ssl1-domain-containing protein n=1 Tax=Cystobasidium minutum MCA 4210 TaxID=1397322 RepID=UPI0034CDF2E0